MIDKKLFVFAKILKNCRKQITITVAQSYTKKTLRLLNRSKVISDVKSSYYTLYIR